MTLAAAILLFFSYTSADAALMAQSAPQSNPEASSQQSPSTQTGSDSTKPSSAQPASKTPENKPPAVGAKKPQQKKKAGSEAACDPAPAASAPGSSISPAPAPAPTGTNAQAPSTAQTNKNCPPRKNIVQEGGVTEQSIQLAGGSTGAETKQKGQSTNQMLMATEENLKKVDGTQLSEAQRNSVSQIREFKEQAEKALKAADFERAQTLAWKAKVLSDDLVAPKK
jgi:hypothetical protein